MDTEIIAWDCELAAAIDPVTREYLDWRKHLTRTRPNVPEKSIRNLRPLVGADAIDRITAERDRLRKALERARAHIVTLGGGYNGQAYGDRIHQAVLEQIDAALTSDTLAVVQK